MNSKYAVSLLSAAAAAAILLALPGVSAAKTYRLSPSSERGNVATFKLPDIEHRSIRSAAVRLGGRPKKVSLRRIRAAARAGVLRVRLERPRLRPASSRLRARASKRHKLRVVTDTTPPDTSIASGPSGTVSATTASFGFSSTESGSTFECSRDASSFSSCTSPTSYSGLGDGSHNFQVRARDAAGNVDPTPASRTWTVSTSSPEPEPTPEPTPTPDPEPAPPGSIFSDTFTGTDGLITNHYAYWSPQDTSAYRNPNWGIESGSMFRQNGTAWTGVPSCGLPNRDSSSGSGSAIFRAHLLRDLPANYKVEFDLRNNGFTQGCSDWPAQDWDGVKIYLRRVNGDNFYTAEVNIRDGHLYIQKKIAGTYHLLASVPRGGYPAKINTWERVGGVVRTNSDGSVTVQVIRDGRVVLEAIDRGTGGSPITAAGRSGFRGDNTNFNVDNFTVSPPN